MLKRGIVGIVSTLIMKIEFENLEIECRSLMQGIWMVRASPGVEPLADFGN